MFEVDDDNDDNDDATLLLALQESDDESEKADKLKQCELNPIPQIEEHAAEVLAAVAEALEGTERDARISEPGQAEAPPPPAANEVAAFPLANEETTVADSNGSPPHTNRQRRIKELREQLEIKRLELELKQLEEEETRQSNQCKTVKESSVDGSLQVSLACKSDNTPRNTSSSISPAGSKRKQSSDRSIGPEDEFSRKQRQAIQQEHSLKQSEPKFKQYLSSTVVSLGDPASASGDFVETYSRLRLSYAPQWISKTHIYMTNIS
jgi:ParB-like chromosome segregation protein Spo0J